MNETELAEYACKKGLYVEQIKTWKDVCLNANGGVARKACEGLGTTEQTFYRWKNRKSNTSSCEDGRPAAIHPEPSNNMFVKQILTVFDILS